MLYEVQLSLEVPGVVVHHVLVLGRLRNPHIQLLPSCIQRVLLGPKIGYLVRLVLLHRLHFSQLVLQGRHRVLPVGYIGLEGNVLSDFCHHVVTG